MSTSTVEFGRRTNMLNDVMDSRQHGNGFIQGEMKFSS
jgi:hypothetical protein